MLLMEGAQWRHPRSPSLEEWRKDITDVDNFKIEVDSELSDTSENPLQNKVVKKALDAKQPAGNYATDGLSILGGCLVPTPQEPYA